MTHSDDSSESRTDRIVRMMRANGDASPVIPDIINFGITRVPDTDLVAEAAVVRIDRSLLDVANEIDDIHQQMEFSIDQRLAGAETIQRSLIGDMDMSIASRLDEARATLGDTQEEMLLGIDLQFGALAETLGTEMIDALALQQTGIPLPAMAESDGLLPQEGGATSPSEVPQTVLPVQQLSLPLQQSVVGDNGNGESLSACQPIDVRAMIRAKGKRFVGFGSAAADIQALQLAEQTGTGISFFNCSAPLPDGSLGFVGRVAVIAPYGNPTLLFPPFTEQVLDPISIGRVTVFQWFEVTAPVPPPGGPIPIPIPPIGIPPSEPPVEEPCIRICDFPPKDPTRPPADAEDPCELTVDVWLNTSTCKLQAFAEGCGPPRVGFGEDDPWVKVPDDPTELCELLEEHRCLRVDEDDDKKPTIPIVNVPGLGQVGIIDACDTIPASIVTVENMPEMLKAILCNAATADNPFLKGPIGDLVKGALHAFACGSGEATKGIFGRGLETLNAIGRSVGCDGAATRASLHLGISTMNFFQQWLGLDFVDYIDLARQNARFLCPLGVMSEQEANIAWLGDQISDSEWRCLVGANNQRPEVYDKVALAQRAKFTPFELSRLRARDIITPEQYGNELRARAWINRTDPDKHWLLSENLPGISDLIRMMVRDAADPAVAQRFGTDSQFGDKFQGQVKDWAEFQRVPEDVMKMVWRAHWTIPSPTQLSEFLQRFRHIPKLWPSALPADFDPNDAALTLVTDFSVDRAVAQDIVAALVQQDILPKWIPLTVAVMFRPPTRVDTRRMLETGIITRAEAEQALAEIGYAPAKAAQIAELGERTARARAVKHPAVRRFADGELREPDLRLILDGDAISPQFHSDAVKRGNLEADARSRKECIRAIERRYLLGEFGDVELLSELVGLGLQANEQDALARRMKCKRLARGRRHPARLLCGWYVDQLIGPDELFERLLRLGFLRNDAVRYVQSCELQLQKKLTAEEVKRLRAARARSRELASASEKEAKELEKMARERKREVRKRQQAAKRRERIVASVADRMAGRLDVSNSVAKGEVSDILDTLLMTPDATTDEILIQLDLASKDEGVVSFPALEIETERLLDVRTFTATPPEDDVL